MADRSLVYRVQINTSQAKSEAKAFAAQIKAELSNIKINVLDGRAFAGADQRIAKLRTELQSLSAIQPPKVSIDTAGIQDAAKQADNLEKQLNDVTSAAQRASTATKNVSAPRPTPAGGVGSGLGGLATGALGAVGVSVSAAAILQGAIALDELRTKAIRADAALIALAGGGTKARNILLSIEQASKGTVTELQAQELAVQGLALNLAKTPAEFEKLTRAAKQITIGSATIKDIGTALTELSLFAANEKSFARADQLAVSASEVKDRMAELQAQNASLTDSQAKLLATMDALDAKFGSVTDSAAANASGIEKVKVAFSDLFKEIATGPVGTGIDAIFGGIGDAVSNGIAAMQHQRANWKIILNIDDLQDNVKVIQDLIASDDIASSAERAFRAISGTSVDASSLSKFVNTVELFNTAVDEGVPGAKEYRAALDAIADDARDGSLTEENIAALQALDTTLVQEIKRYRELAEAKNSALSGPDEEALSAAQDALTKTITDKGVDVAPLLGASKANELVQQQVERAQQLIADLRAQGKEGIELEISIALAENSLTSVFDSVSAAAEQQLGSNIATTLSAELARGLTEANSAAFDGSAALAGYRDELISLSLEITSTGTATEEQAARVRELVGVFDGAASSTGVYAALQSDAGQALLESNAYASELATQIALLDAAQAAGKISAETHAGALYSLVGALIAAAQQAGVTGAALAGLQAIQAGIQQSGTPGFNRGAAAGDAITAALGAQEAARQRDEQRRAAERAAREQEAAAKRAGKELESAAKRAGKELESALQSVEGLFGLSKVTQKDLDFAAAGGSVNFADDFVRRFRDAVENGVLHEGAGVEEVKRALQNVGIKPAEDLKLLLGQLEEAWQNSSLFANKDNLSLINADAVQQSLDLQEKMKQGRENIMAYFGVAIDDATGAVSGVATDPAAADGLKTAVTDGKQKIIDHLAVATTSAVDAATAAQPTAGVTGASGSVQITSLTIAPGALEGLFAGIVAPAIQITSVTIEKGVGAAITTELGAEISKQTDYLFGIGGGIASQIQLGVEGHDFAPSGSTVIDEISSGIAAPANLQRLSGMGGGIAGFIQLGLDEYDFAPSGTAIVDDISAGLVSPESVAKLNNIGGGAASQIRIGFDAYSFDAAGSAILNDVSAGLATPESMIKHYAIGSSIGGLIQIGLDSFDFRTSGDTILSDLQTGISNPKSLQLMYGIGGGIASFVQLGLMDYDFGSAGSSMVTSIASGIRSEDSIGTLVSAGHSIADALFNGFSARAPEADWVGVIVGAVLAQLNAGVEQN